MGRGTEGRMGDECGAGSGAEEVEREDGLERRQIKTNSYK